MWEKIAMERRRERENVNMKSSWAGALKMKNGLHSHLFAAMWAMVNDDMNLLVLADGVVFSSCNRTTEKSQCAYKMKRSFMEWLQFYGNAHLFYKTLINSKRKFAKIQKETEYAPDVIRYHPTWCIQWCNV